LPVALLAALLAIFLAALPARAGNEPGGSPSPAPGRFRLCSMDVDYPPYARVDGSGHLQYLAQQAARGLGVELERRVAPRRRCVEELKAGLVDGMVGAWSAERAEYAMFPMAGGGPDERRAVATPRYFLYRRKGTQLDWDGQRFTGQWEGRIGVESGFIFIMERLQQLGMPYDDGGKSLEPNMEKLLAGRLDGVIAMETEADQLIAARYEGKIEKAGKPFEQTPLYLMVSRQFHAQYGRFAGRYWQALAEYRSTADYRQYQQAHP
jgi:polar amino acid transport system substrate-binding protein